MYPLPESTRDLYDEVAALRQELAEADRKLAAAQHAVDLYRQGNVMATVVAVARLGEVLETVEPEVGT